MRTGAAESDVWIRVAQDVERVGVIEDLFVEVGRAVGHHQPLALLDLHAAQLGVFECGPLERRDRGGPPDDLVGRGLRGAGTRPDDGGGLAGSRASVVWCRAVPCRVGRGRDRDRGVTVYARACRRGLMCCCFPSRARWPRSR